MVDDTPSIGRAGVNLYTSSFGEAGVSPVFREDDPLQTDPRVNFPPLGRVGVTLYVSRFGEAGAGCLMGP